MARCYYKELPLRPRDCLIDGQYEGIPLNMRKETGLTGGWD